MAGGAAAQSVATTDDAGRTVTLPRPAQRIVTVAPHATELVAAAGGTDRLVGTDRYSDFPERIRDLPHVGDGLHLDIERVLALKPDLLVLWAYGDGRPGTAALPMALLEQAGVAVFYSNPRTMADIPAAIEKLGRMIGTSAVADAQAARQRATLARLAATYAGKRPVRTFYQLGSQPIYTLNGRSIVNDALRLCGAANIFASLPATAPQVGLESVLLANPEAIVTSESGPQGRALLDAWRAYAPGLTAAARGNLYTADADGMNRPGPRLIEATARLCEDIAEARRRLH